MVEVGSLEIAGSLNAESIKHGLDEIKTGLEEAKESAKSAFGDMSRLGDTISSMAGPLAVIGGAASSALMAVATMAPQVAPHLQRMKADFFRLATTVGEVFEPIFKEAADSFSGFVDWLNTPQGKGVLRTVKKIIEGFSEGLGDTITSLNEISKDWSIGLDVDVGEGLKWAAKHLGPELFSAWVGYKVGFKYGGPAGGAAGGAMAAGTTATVRGATNEGPIATLKTIFGPALAGAGAGATAGLAGGPFAEVTVPGGAIAGFIAGATAGEAIEMNKQKEDIWERMVWTSKRAQGTLFGWMGGVNEEEQARQQTYKNANKE